MVYIIIGIIVFFATAVVARMQTEKALTLLTNEQKSSLVGKGGTKTKTISIIVLAVIIVGFLMLAYYHLLDRMVALGAYMGTLMVYFIVMGVINLNTFKSLQLPAEFMKKITTASIIRIFGMCILIICMAIGMSEVMKQQM